MLFNNVDRATDRSSRRPGLHGGRAALRRGVRRTPGGRAGPSQQTRTAAAQQRFPQADRSLQETRREAISLVEARKGETYNDTNYIFLTFVMRHLPVGIVGLIIAAVFAAAMSTISAELNSLATRHGRRSLPALSPQRAARRALRERGPHRDGILGPLRHHVRQLRRPVGLAHRSRQHRRVVFLRLDAGGVRAGVRALALERPRRLCGHASRARRRRLDQPEHRHFVSCGSTSWAASSRWLVGLLVSRMFPTAQRA